MKVALVQDWLVKFGGAEWTLLNWHKIFPDAPLYTLVYDRKKMGMAFEDFDVRTTYIQKIPGAIKHYQMLLPLMPGAWERLDLTEYDLVLSSCSSCCKGIITRPDAVHICYCHTPTRYFWDMFYEYKRQTNPIKGFLMTNCIHKLRMWDKLAADRVDYFLANSKFTQQRIKKYYKRDADIIYSVGGNFVSDELFEKTENEDFYLITGRLVGYKRFDLAIEACSRLGKRLIVVGTGNEEENLKKIAGSTVEFKGYCSNEEIMNYYARAKGFLFPGLEDFGFTPIEAQSGGTPVIAFGKGGALETVANGETGLFFQKQTVDALIEAIKNFEKHGVKKNRSEIRKYANTFSAERFRQEILNYCMSKTVEQGICTHMADNCFEGKDTAGIKPGNV